MRKKFLVSMLTAAMAVTSLAGCSNSNNGPTGSSENGGNTSSQANSG